MGKQIPPYSRHHQANQQTLNYELVGEHGVHLPWYDENHHLHRDISNTNHILPMM